MAENGNNDVRIQYHEEPRNNAKIKDSARRYVHFSPRQACNWQQGRTSWQRTAITTSAFNITKSRATTPRSRIQLEDTFIFRQGKHVTGNKGEHHGRERQ